MCSYHAIGVVDVRSAGVVDMQQMWGQNTLNNKLEVPSRTLTPCAVLQQRSMCCLCCININRSTDGHHLA